MPDRILRKGIIDSEPVNKLSWGGEVFYRRLMSVADDYGRFDGRVSLLRANLYPVKLNQVSDADVGKWLHECCSAGLVSVYQVEGKPFVLIKKFDQRLRAMRSKFPPPPDDVSNSLTDDRSVPPESRVENRDSETDLESESKQPAIAELPKKVLKEKKIEPDVVLPWDSEQFKTVWTVWKEYRWREKRQKFKTSASELAQLKHLQELAGEQEVVAIKIIEQSIGNTWTGLFQLKNTQQNGKANSQTGTPIWRKPVENT
jgi:hypothetical protein